VEKHSRYTYTDEKRSSSCFVYITPDELNYSFRLSSNASSLLGLEVDRCDILFDKEKRQILISPSLNGEFKVSKGRNRRRSICAQGLFTILKFKSGKRYDVHKAEKGILFEYESI
jgi:hypothetical protein